MQGKVLSTAPQTVHQKARKLLRLILTRRHRSLLDIPEASVSQPTPITTGASASFHGYPGILRVILFPQAWKADLVGGIVKNGCCILFKHAFFSFFSAFYCCCCCCCSFLRDCVFSCVTRCLFPCQNCNCA